MTTARTAQPPLKFLAPGWFALVMGWGGLGLAWHQATPLLGDPAAGIAQGLGWSAIATLGILLVLTGIRLQRHAPDLMADLRHPVRHPLLAMIPMAMLVVAGFAVQVLGANKPGEQQEPLRNIQRACRCAQQHRDQDERAGDDTDVAFNSHFKISKVVLS